MDTKQQARALMMNHHKMVKNRQQSMLGRISSEIGVDVNDCEYWNNFQKTPLSGGSQVYNRSHVSLS